VPCRVTRFLPNAGRLPLTHEALDACPRRNAAGYLRHMLTVSDALPQRDEHLAPTGQWLNLSFKWSKTAGQILGRLCRHCSRVSGPGH